jgi:hypothetical protein
MGYIKRPGTEIWDFTPDDTDTEMYIMSDLYYSITELLEMARAKWSDASLDNIKIASQRIHTHCIYYDLHDPTDYTDYLILKYVG